MAIQGRADGLAREVVTVRLGWFWGCLGVELTGFPMGVEQEDLGMIPRCSQPERLDAVVG